ncbi:MAG: hypothetical protein EOO50_11395 [Flavobacterium sp.]|uniref:hypothetical protein n=1 Tax=Flavobacterium sp. TaxID=239 RepID=UPI00122B53BE|nr:hypothetical protein [Flavobacterium sp.]RZJ66010.1 MAG: hypothetical protein EOO50_11395 [Flavobacterium sp.]
MMRQSNDVFHMIHLDSRGSWSGTSNSLKTEIAVISVFDTDVLVKNYEPISGVFIENIVPGIRNYSQITKEYELFANYIGRNLINHVLPYFESSKYKENLTSYRKDNLILFRELGHHNPKKAIEIIKAKIEILRKLQLADETKFWEKLEFNTTNNNWQEIDAILDVRKKEVFKKLKINSVSG